MIGLSWVAYHAVDAGFLERHAFTSVALECWFTIVIGIAGGWAPWRTLFTLTITLGVEIRETDLSYGSTRASTIIGHGHGGTLIGLADGLSPVPLTGGRINAFSCSLI